MPSNQIQQLVEELEGVREEKTKLKTDLQENIEMVRTCLISMNETWSCITVHSFPRLSLLSHFK